MHDITYKLVIYKRINRDIWKLCPNYVFTRRLFLVNSRVETRTNEDIS